MSGIDWDLHGHTAAALANAIGSYPHRFTARPNRGVDSGRDLDGDGRIGGADDAFGYAEFAGQGAIAVVSRFPFSESRWRDFSEVAWQDMPGTLAKPSDPPRRLSTTVHWDLPVQLPDGELHLLIWHATPPVFDGPEDRNGRRNHDEAAFWLAYLDGQFGTPPDRFVLLGTANADPVDGDSRRGALRTLLEDVRVRDPRPVSVGAVAAARDDGGINRRQTGDPALDTVDWPDAPRQPGNLRVDYLLPSSGLSYTRSGVFWPPPEDPLADMASQASRHRLVWLDITIDTRRTLGRLTPVDPRGRAR